MMNASSIVLAALLVLTTAGASGALVPPLAKGLAPHRAVYDLKLDTAKDAADVTDASGRIVFEFAGSACEGFTQNMRFVLKTTNKDGVSNLSDLRTSTWEDADGRRFRFNQKNFDNQQEGQTLSGNALRDEGTGKVAVSIGDSGAGAKPLSLPSGVLFPVQHTLSILAAAEKGDAFMSVNLFDGSDNGNKVYFTNTLIGHEKAKIDDSEIANVKNAEKLKAMRSWPVNVAFFNEGSDKAEGTPSQEMGFRLYENGVVRSLHLDYGTMSLNGTLAEIEFYPPAVCPSN